jgi:NADH dehydrogenase FAD-containing subunit
VIGDLAHFEQEGAPIPGVAPAAMQMGTQAAKNVMHQVHGAIGFTREHDMHRYLRHATAAALAFGDSDFHWDRLADRLGLPRDPSRAAYIDPGVK